jgi:hypothetical protein
VALTDAVAQGLTELRASFPSSTVSVVEDGDGGAFVKVAPLDLGDRNVPAVSWVGFRLLFTYPETDVYPHFTEVLHRADGSDRGAGYSETQWGPEGKTEAVTQLSRASKGWKPTVGTAAIKLQSVLEWLRG